MNIDDALRLAVLRLKCLVLALTYSQTPHSEVYNVVDEAEKYWQFVRGSIWEAAPAAPKPGDIPS